MSDKLRQIIREMVIEEEIALAQDSLDDQIDSILLRFESDSIIDEDSGMGEGLIDLGQLVEAPEDEEDPADKDAADADAEEPTGDEEPDSKDDAVPDAESEPMHPNIDVSKFASNVARLVTSYENLLDIPVVIATRAYNHLLNNYDQAVADEFETVMASNFGIDTMKREPTSEPETLPIAVGAGASGIGGP